MRASTAHDACFQTPGQALRRDEAPGCGETSMMTQRSPQGGVLGELVKFVCRSGQIDGLQRRRGRLMSSSSKPAGTLSRLGRLMQVARSCHSGSTCSSCPIRVI